MRYNSGKYKVSAPVTRLYVEPPASTLRAETFKFYVDRIFTGIFHGSVNFLLHLTLKQQVYPKQQYITCYQTTWRHIP
jgi:hypothetical protein